MCKSEFLNKYANIYRQHIKILTWQAIKKNDSLMFTNCKKWSFFKLIYPLPWQTTPIIILVLLLVQKDTFSESVSPRI